MTKIFCPRTGNLGQHHNFSRDYVCDEGNEGSERVYDMWKIHVEKAYDKMEFYHGNFGGLENNPLDSKEWEKKNTANWKFKKDLSYYCGN